MYRDQSGRFAVKPVPVIAATVSLPKVHRDSQGRFAPKPPLYPKADANGVYRNKNGSFASKPVNLFKTPKPKTITVTVAQVIDAIAKNGYTHTRGWGVFEGKKMVSGCAIAQGAENLGVDGITLSKVLNNNVNNLGHTIISLNDDSRLTIPQIVARVRKYHGHLLSRTITVPTK